MEILPKRSMNMLEVSVGKKVKIFTNYFCMIMIIFRLQSPIFCAAYDFLNTNEMNFNIILWHNSTHGNHGMRQQLLRLPKSLNMVSIINMQFSFFFCQWQVRSFINIRKIDHYGYKHLEHGPLYKNVGKKFSKAPHKTLMRKPAYNNH